MEPSVQRIFGFHVWPTLPRGVIGGRSGVILAASDKFRLILQGKGGHAAMPHLTHDPVTTSAAVISALQTLVSRETSPLDSAVVSVTQLSSGDNAYNVIPNAVHMGGTIRALTEDGLTRVRERFKEVASKVAEAHNCELELAEFSPDPYPPTLNDHDLWHNFVLPTAGAACQLGDIVEVGP